MEHVPQQVYRYTESTRHQLRLCDDPREWNQGGQFPVPALHGERMPRQAYCDADESVRDLCLAR